MSQSNKGISPEIGQLCNIDDELFPFLEVKDTVKTDEPGYELVLIRAIKDHRLFWIEHLKGKDAVLAGSFEKLQELSTQSFPTDIFDSGVVYLIDYNRKNSKIVCRSDDFPQTITADPTLVSNIFDEGGIAHEFRDNLRIWVEGTVIRVFTIQIQSENGDFKNYTFYSTRSKIDSTNSQWEQGEGKPFIKQAFIDAAQNQNIDLKSFLDQEDLCHVFILRHPFNQIFSEIDQPEVYHIRSYKCGTTCTELKGDRVPGAKVLEKLTPDQAIRYIRNQGTVITMNPFKNVKIMQSDVMEKYEWMNDPVEKWYSFHGNPSMLQEFSSILVGRNKVLIDEVERLFEPRQNAMINFIHERLKLKIKQGKQYKELNSQNFVLTRVLAAVQKRFKIAKDNFDEKAALAKAKKAARGKPVRKPKVWYRKDEINAIKEELQELLTTNGDKYLQLQRFIEKEIKSENAKKARSEGKAPTQPKKSKKPIKVFAPDITEQLFVPDQTKWADMSPMREDASI